MQRFKLRWDISQRRQIQLAWALLVLCIVIYAVLISYLSDLRYDTFKATAFDLGNMDQVIWNTLHGHPFLLTNQGQDWYGPPTRLAIHFEPILLLLSLLYFFHADPRTLLIFQTLAMAAGALPVFLLTRKYIPMWPLAAAMMAIAYLASPPLLGINLFDFHPFSLVTPLLLYAILALEYKRYGWFLLTCILAASCKEDVPIAIALLGALIMWKYKLPRLGSVLIVGGLLWFLIAFAVIIPHFYPGAQHNNFWYRYEELGTTPGEAVINILFHPWLLLTTFVTMDRFYYLANITRSTGFLSIFAPEWLLPATFSLAENLLSTDSNTYSGVYHYNAIIIPFIMLSAIHGLARIINAWQEWRNEAPTEAPAAIGESVQRPAGQGKMGQALQSLYQRVSTPYAHILSHPTITRSKSTLHQRIAGVAHTRDTHWQRFSERMTPLAQAVPLPSFQWFLYIWLLVMIGLNFAIMHPQLSIFWPEKTPGYREQHIQQLLSLIPPDASVSAGENLNPHLSEREYVTVFPEITYTTITGTKKTVQYVAVDLNAIFPEDKVSTAKEINQLLSSQQFRTVGRAEGVILLANNSP